MGGEAYGVAGVFAIIHAWQIRPRPASGNYEPAVPPTDTRPAHIEQGAPGSATVAGRGSA